MEYDTKIEFNMKMIFIKSFLFWSLTALHHSINLHLLFFLPISSFFHLLFRSPSICINNFSVQFLFFFPHPMYRKWINFFKGCCCYHLTFIGSRCVLIIYSDKHQPVSVSFVTVKYFVVFPSSRSTFFFKAKEAKDSCPLLLLLLFSFFIFLLFSSSFFLLLLNFAKGG